MQMFILGLPSDLVQQAPLGSLTCTFTSPHTQTPAERQKRNNNGETKRMKIGVKDTEQDFNQCVAYGEETVVGSHLP